MFPPLAGKRNASVHQSRRILNQRKLLFHSVLFLDLIMFDMIVIADFLERISTRSAILFRKGFI